MDIEQIRFIIIVGLIVGAVLLLSWRSRKSMIDFRARIIAQTEEGKTVQKDIAGHLDRIATALETHIK